MRRLAPARRSPRFAVRRRPSADSRILDAPPQQRVVTSPDLPGGLPEFDIGVDAPNSLAADTGGLFIHNENDLPKALRDIASDTSSYYVLGYRPPLSRDGKFHSIRVTVTRPQLTVRARRGYLASADGASPAAAPPTTPPPQPAPAVNLTAPNAPPTLGVSAPAWTATARMDVPTVAAALGASSHGNSDGVRLRPAARAPVDDAVRLRNGASAAANTEPIADSLMAQARDGWAAYQQGDTKTALTVLSASAENPAAPPWVNYVLGWAAFAEGQWVVARNAWNVVRATVPDFIAVYFDIADAYLRQGKAAEALVVLRAADNRWPGSLEVLNAVGVVQTSVGQLDEAIGQFEKALAAAPDDSSTRFNLGGAKELRYVRSLRQLPPAEPDRRDAIAEYRRVAEASGAFSEAARAGLRRLIPLDIRSLTYTPPVALATLTQSVLHGRPVRLAWSRDGQQVYVMGLGSKTEGHVLVSVPAGAITPVSNAPEWSRPYWSWKAGQKAPWLPSLAIKSETKRVTAFNSTDPGNRQRAYAPSGTQSTSNVLLLHGEVIAEANSGYVLPGFTFSWSPFAMGALAFATPRNRLAIMDSEGRRTEVAGTRDVVLPAWSEDGARIAYVVPSGNNWVLQLISLSVRD